MATLTIIEALQDELSTLKAQMADVLKWRAGARLDNIEQKLGIKPPDGGEPYARSTPPHVVQP